MPTRRITIFGPLVCLMVGSAAVGIAVGGCTAPRAPRIVSDPDPSVKIPAIKLAVEGRNSASIPQLVKDLENDDPAVRLYAIEALERLTRQNLGYVYYQNDEQRHAATLRWQAWLRERESGTPPGGTPEVPSESLSGTTKPAALGAAR